MNGFNYHLSKKLNENSAMPTLIDFSYQLNVSIWVFDSGYKDPYFIVYNHHDAPKATKCIRVLCHVSKVIQDQIKSKLQGAVSISIRNNSNALNSLLKIDVPNVSYLVDELLWSVRCNTTDNYYTLLCVEAFGDTSSIDILPRTYTDLFQWIRVSINDFICVEKFKFEYENKHLDGVECDMCIAVSEDMYSSLKLPKTSIGEELSKDCYINNYRLSNLTIRMIQEEII